MIKFIVFAIFASLIFLLFLKFNKRILKKKKFIKFTKENLYKWMNLTKKERYDLSKNDSDKYLNERKNLLDQIRKEYKIITKTNKNKF